MIKDKNVIVFDIDKTLCNERTMGEGYEYLIPKDEVIAKLREYKNNGFWIILFTARQMKTYQGNVGEITANAGKLLFDWLEKYEIPYDELHFGKPWCGHNGFYVDDRAIRPSEFIENTYKEIIQLLTDEGEKL